MKAVEASAATREEAIQKALDELGLEMYEVDKIEILDEGSKGLFGFGARPVRVKVLVEGLPETPSRPAREASEPSRGGGNGGRGGQGDRGRRGGSDRNQDTEQKSGGDGPPDRGRDGDRGRGRGGRDRNRDDSRGPRRDRGAGQDRAASGGGEGGQGREQQSNRDGDSGRGQDRDRDTGRSPGREREGGRDQNRERSGGQPQNREGGRGAGRDRDSGRNQNREGGRGPARDRDGGRGSNRDRDRNRTIEAPRDQDEASGKSATPDWEEKKQDTGVDSASEPKINDPAAMVERDEMQECAPIEEALGREAAVTLETIIKMMGMESKAEFARVDDGTARLNVSSEDGALLIGRKGRNLNALQYLINRMITRNDTAENTERLVVDVEGYVDRRRSSLEDMALSMAQKAKDSGRNMRLKPLSPQERRIIHLTLQNDEDIRTFSLGDSLYRSVVISPKNATNDRPQYSGRGRRGGRGRGGGGGGGNRQYSHYHQGDYDAGAFGD